MSAGRSHSALTAMVVAPSLGGGGAEKATLLVAGGLQRLGVETHLVLEKDVALPLFSVPTVKQVHELHSPSTLRSVLPLAKLIRAHRPDILYTALPHLNILGALSILISRRRVRLISSVHNNLNEEFRDLDGAGRLQLLTPWAYRRSFRIVAVSRGVADSISDNVGDPQKITVIPNPVDDDAFNLDVAMSTRRKMRVDAGAPRVLSMGRFVPQKNFSLLLDAFSRFLPHFPAATLTILGDGPLRSSLERQADALGIGDSVSMPGVHSRPAEFLNDSDLYVQTSDFEGFGLAILEAMASGLPCVSTDCDFGPRELIEDQVSGYLTASEPIGVCDAMVRALTPSDRSEVLGRRGYELAEAFSVENVSREILLAATAGRSFYGTLA